MTDHDASDSAIQQTEEQAKNPGISEAVDLYQKADEGSFESEGQPSELFLKSELRYLDQ